MRERVFRRVVGAILRAVLVFGGGYLVVRWPIETGSALGFGAIGLIVLVAALYVLYGLGCLLWCVLLWVVNGEWPHDFYRQHFE